jgi:hypothetical protein
MSETQAVSEGRISEPTEDASRAALLMRYDRSGALASAPFEHLHESSWASILFRATFSSSSTTTYDLCLPGASTVAAL